MIIPTPHQLEAIRKATQGPIGLLTGSPGTGKTAVTAWVIQQAIQRYGAGMIAVLAPTGKAAVRISEVLSQQNVPIEATTLHRALRCGDESELKPETRSIFGVKFIFVDEASMVGTGMMCQLMWRKHQDTNVLLVGDPNQLSPVPHGKPLVDMIQMGLPCGELREIIRNQGGIVQACADIRDGKQFQCEGNLIHIPAKTPEKQIAAITSLCSQVEASGLSPVADLQIICPVNKKQSPVGRTNLNPMFQAQLNPHAPVAGTPFRLGDKVVCLKNGDTPLLEDEHGTARKGLQTWIANGEMGFVVKSEPNYMDVELTCPYRIVRVPRGSNGDDEDDEEGTSNTGCHWDLAYALSGHKAQGSEFPIVALVIDEYAGAKMVCDRSWIYTGISRAKQQCYLIGDLRTARQFCRKIKIHDRKTLLAEHYWYERALAVLEGM